MKPMSQLMQHRLGGVVLIVQDPDTQPPDVTLLDALAELGYQLVPLIPAEIAHLNLIGDNALGLANHAVVDTSTPLSPAVARTHVQVSEQPSGGATPIANTPVPAASRVFVAPSAGLLRTIIATASLGTLLVGFGAVLTGCATPFTVPATDTTPAHTEYRPNDTAMQVSGGLNSAAPLALAPYDSLLKLLAGLVATVATGFAVVKNSTAKTQTQLATKHANAALAIASVIVGQPALASQAIQAGAKNGSANTVAAHIDAANSPV